MQDLVLSAQAGGDEHEEMCVPDKPGTHWVIFSYICDKYLIIF